jgi:hypothetical protein
LLKLRLKSKVVKCDHPLLPIIPSDTLLEFIVAEYRKGGQDDLDADQQKTPDNESGTSMDTEPGTSSKVDEPGASKNSGGKKPNKN